MKTQAPAQKTTRIGRPPTGKTGQDCKLYLTPAIITNGKKRAFKAGKSFSDYVEELIALDLAAKKGAK